jgi:hypothetical protein
MFKLCVYLSACNPGSFGTGCAETCRCKSNVSCDHINGACPDGMCEIGYKGTNCSQGKNCK